MHHNDVKVARSLLSRYYSTFYHACGTTNVPQALVLSSLYRETLIPGTWVPCFHPEMSYPHKTPFVSEVMQTRTFQAAMSDLRTWKFVSRFFCDQGKVTSDVDIDDHIAHRAVKAPLPTFFVRLETRAILEAAYPDLRTQVEEEIRACISAGTSVDRPFLALILSNRLPRLPEFQWHKYTDTIWNYLQRDYDTLIYDYIDQYFSAREIASAVEKL